jgi:hypothetical protein
VWLRPAPKGFLPGHATVGGYALPAAAGTYAVPASALEPWPEYTIIELTDGRNWLPLALPPLDNSQWGWVLDRPLLTMQGRG